MSSTQELSLLTLFIILPVSSDQTDFIIDSDKMSKGIFVLHVKLVAVQKHVPVTV